MDHIMGVVKLAMNDGPNPGKPSLGGIGPSSGLSGAKPDRITISKHNLRDRSMQKSHLECPKLCTLNRVNPLRGNPTSGSNEFTFFVDNCECPSK